MTSGFVIDASAAIEFTREGRGAELPDSVIFAPSLIDIEVMNAFRRLVRLGITTPERAGRRLRDWADTGITRSGHELLLSRIWELRENFSAYDGTYVALAERLDVPLITADRRLARAAAPYCDVITLD